MPQGAVLRTRPPNTGNLSIGQKPQQIKDNHPLASFKYRHRGDNTLPPLCRLTIGYAESRSTVNAPDYMYRWQ